MMLVELLKGLLGIAVILTIWIGIQRAFRRATGLAADADPLAGHVRCHGCKCQGECDNRNQHPTR